MRVRVYSQEPRWSYREANRSDVSAGGRSDVARKPILGALVIKYHIDFSSMNELIRTLDEIWLSEAPRKTAAIGAKNLSATGVRELLAVLACSVLPGEIHAIRLPESTSYLTLSRGGAVVEAIINDGEAKNALVVLPDLGKSLVLPSSGKSARDGTLTIDAQTALLALQVARDHSDGIVLTPPPLRESRLKKAAAELAIEFPLFTELCARAPSLLMRHV
jgi:hypothetical protein